MVSIAEEEKQYNHNVPLKQMQSTTHTQFTMKWTNICNCIRHEMAPKIASIITFYTNEEDDLTTSSESNLIQQLKHKRKLGIEERAYLIKLIQRSRSFELIADDNTS